MRKEGHKNVVNTELEEKFLDLEKQLRERDFSKESNKKAVFINTLNNINELEGVNDMKRIGKAKKAGVAVASIALVLMIGMQTTFAQELVEKIIAKISFGHVTAMQYEEQEIKKERPVPDALKGKIFDKEGKPIEIFTGEVREVYTVKGEKIDHISPKGEIITEAEAEKFEAETTLIVRDSKQLNDYTCFKVILPDYLPKGYAFDRAEFYKDEKGIVKNSKYISLYFSNSQTGKTIFMQQRFADEETAYEFGTDEKIEEIKINGADAIIENNRAIHWEANGNIYFLILGTENNEVSKDELIKIAESVK